MSLCGSCGARIFWCLTPAGKSMPIDAEPVLDGNVRVRDGKCQVLSQVAAIATDELLHKSHFATCPNAGQHRKAA